MSEQRPEETDRRTQLWACLIGSAFLGVTAGAAAVLALGGAPAWVEMVATGCLWTVGLFFLLGFGLVPVCELNVRALERDPDKDPRVRQHLDQLREARQRKARQTKPEPKPRPWWRRPVAYAGRLAYVGFLAALVVSGRPVLAGLYVLLVVTGIASSVHLKTSTSRTGRRDVGAFAWAVYRTVGFVLRLPGHALRILYQLAKWLLWIPLLAAIAACLLSADVRLRPRLRRALGLPRALAYLLYGRPWRRIWRKVLPTGFWIVAMVLAVALALDGLSAPLAAAATAALWDIGPSLLALAILSFSAMVFFEEPNLSRGPRTLGWPRAAGPYLLLLLRLVFLGALCAAGEWLLAGLYLSLVCVVTAIAWFDAFDGVWTEQALANPFPGMAAVVGMCIALVPFLFILSPILVPGLVYDLFSDRRTARRLREACGRTGGLVYFLYGAAHQREHFLGPGGVLAPWGGWVVARDWRKDVTPARQAVGWTRFSEGAEGRLLKRHEITNRRGDLPFLAVVGSRGWPKSFKLSKPYRARRTDDGKALRRIEQRIAKALARRFGSG